MPIHERTSERRLTVCRRVADTVSATNAYRTAGSRRARPGIGNERVCSPVGVSALLLRRRGTTRRVDARVGRGIPSADRVVGRA
jgi:hypothetical protein